MSKTPNLEEVKNASIDEIKSIFSELENLLDNIKEDADDNTKSMKNKLIEKLSSAKKRIDDFESSSKEKAIHVYENSRDYVKENPATTTGIVAAAGVLVGLLAYKSCCKNK